MKLFLISLTFVLLFWLNIQYVVGQELTFLPHGKPIVRVFSDFSTQMSHGKSHSAFQMSRAYFGYSYHISPHLSGRILFDVANSRGLQPSSFTAILKNAYAMYSTDAFAASFGMISTQGFALSEKQWGKRYLYKSMQDEYGFSSSADLGASISYRFIPQLSVDVSVFNGEGYKKIEMDSALQLAAGITMRPFKQLSVRLYGDYMKTSTEQYTLAAFLGYQDNKANIGVEYAYQHGHRLRPNHNYGGVSAFGTYALAPKLSMFVRFDHIQSNSLQSENIAWRESDGQVYITGLEYAPVKGIKLSPNLRQIEYANGTAATHVFINLEMSL